MTEKINVRKGLGKITAGGDHEITKYFPSAESGAMDDRC